MVGPAVAAAQIPQGGVSRGVLGDGGAALRGAGGLAGRMAGL